MIRRCTIVGVAVMAALGIAHAQTMDGNGGSIFVPAHSTVQLTNFNLCVVVANNTATDAQYEFGSAAEWTDFVNNPNPGVIHSACPNQPAPPPASPPPAQPSAGCTDPKTGAQDPIGTQFTTMTPGTETCSAAGFGAGATGTATTSTSATFECLPASGGPAFQQISSSTTVTSTSGCLNSAGGACVPVSASACTALNTSSPFPACKFTQAAVFPILGSIPPQFHYVASKSESHLTYALSKDQCSCVASTIEIDPFGAPFTQGPFSTPNPPVPADLAFLSSCPNVIGQCIIQPFPSQNYTGVCPAP